MSNAPGCQCGQAHGACTTEFQYAVKLVCGEVKANTTNAPVAPGRYWTAINIHNFDECKDAHFRWKVAVAEPGRQGPILAFSRPQTLSPDGAMEIDCPQVRQIFPPPAPPFVKGYLVLESDIEVDVVAVYTGAQAADGPLNTFHTERVQPRCVPVCEDLVLPLNTGVAAWQTISPAPAGPVVTLSNLPAPWVGVPFGFTWVSQLAIDSSAGAVGWRRYELCFDLCAGFVRPAAAIPLQILVDNTAEISLNGSGPVSSTGNVATIPGPLAYASPNPLSVSPALLRAGRNCFHVDINNTAVTPNPTGFALTGILRIARGKCPCARLPIL